MKLKKPGIAIVVILLGALAFLNRKDIKLSGQDGSKLEKISDAGYQLQSVIRLNNANLLSSTIKTINENFYLNGVKIGTLNNDISQGVPGRKESDLPVSIRFPLADYLKATNRDTTALSAELRIEGEITFQNMLSTGKITVNETGKISLK